MRSSSRFINAALTMLLQILAGGKSEKNPRIQNIFHQKIRELLPKNYSNAQQYLKKYETQYSELKNIDDFIGRYIDVSQLRSELKSFFAEIFSGEFKELYLTYEIEELSQGECFKLLPYLKYCINTKVANTKDDLTSEIGQSFCLLIDNLPSLFKDVPIDIIRISLKQICDWFFMLIEFSQEIFNAKKLTSEAKDQLLSTLKDFRHPTFENEEEKEETLSAFSIQSITAVCEHLPNYFESFQKPPKDNFALSRNSAALINQTAKVISYKKNKDCLSLEIKSLEEQARIMKEKIKIYSTPLEIVSTMLRPAVTGDPSIKKPEAQAAKFSEPFITKKSDLQQALDKLCSKIQVLKNNVSSLESKCTFA